MGFMLTLTQGYPIKNKEFKRHKAAPAEHCSAGAAFSMKAFYLYSSIRLGVAVI